MNLSHFTINGISWMCISVFYERENWPLFIKYLINYYNKNINIFDGFSFSFAEEKGDSVRVVFTVKGNDVENLKIAINRDFHEFLRENPSKTKQDIPYGEILWGYYPNNTIEWNRFNVDFLVKSYDKLNDFSKYSSLLTASYIEDEVSLDDTISIAVFYTVLLLKLMKNLEGIDTSFNEINKIIKTKNRQNNIDLIGNKLFEEDYLFEVINSYWDDELKKDEIDELLNSWLVEVKNIYKGEFENIKFVYLVTYIYRQLGLNIPIQIFIIDIFLKWFNKKQHAF